MPGPLLHLGAVVQCPHMVPAVLATTQPRVVVSGQPVLLATDAATIAGCPFTVPPGTPMPCVRVQWLTPAARVLVNGVPPVTQASTGLALSAQQTPNGPVVAATAQPRVVAT